MSGHDPHVARPGWACLLCPPPVAGHDWSLSDAGYRTCGQCRTWLATLLADIAERYIRLDPRPGSGAGEGTRGAPGFGSRSPARDHVVAMMDPRSREEAKVWVGADGRVHREDTAPVLSVHAVLRMEALGIAFNRSIAIPDPRANVFDLVRWLSRHIDWVTRHDYVVNLAGRLQQVHRQLAGVTGAKRVRIGRCPVPDAEGIACSAWLYAPADATVDFVITCESCVSSWERGQFAELSHQLAAPELEAA